MFLTYLRRELGKRRKQTALIASGLAIAIALVVVVAGVANGIKSAQASALSGLYGIGTDLTVTKTEVFDPEKMGQRFEVGSDEGSSDGEKRSFSASRLEVQRGTSTLTQAEVDKVAAANGVAATAATLKLSSVTFSGEMPVFNESQSTDGNTAAGGEGNTMPAPPSGGSDGMGGSAFGVDTFSVEGISVVSDASDTIQVGPLAATTITDGRALTAADAEAHVAVIDSAYATSAELAIGDTITIAETDFEVVGIVESGSAAAATPSNVYIPIAVAQTLSDSTDAFTTIYVAAESAAQIDATKAAIEEAAPDATVSSQSDLASTVSGSLATASSLVSDMGGWLAAVVLLAAFGTSILFTTSGVNRRTREFGTLKAIGWRSRRIVGQVMGESLVTGVIGGILGLGLGVGAIYAINAFGPSLSASVGRSGFFGGGPGGDAGQAGQAGEMPAGGFGGPGGGGSGSTSTAMELTLNASIEPWMILAALGFAILGGLLAGAFGGLRAAKLSPAQALRSIA